jgi:hypothetical protein
MSADFINSQKERTLKTHEESIVFLIGQISVLGVGLSAVLNHHPDKDAVVLEIQEICDAMIAESSQAPHMASFVNGIKRALNRYVLMQ